MMDDDRTDPVWSEDDDEEILDDEAGRQAADHLRGQLELFPELTGTPGDRAKFGITRENLRGVARVTNLNPPKFEQDQVLAAVNISANRLQLTAKLRSVTCRAAAPLEPDSKGELYGAVTFGFPLWQLDRLGAPEPARWRTGDFERLNCDVDPSKTHWNIRFKKRRRMTLDLTTYPAPDDACASWDLQEQVHVTQFDPRILKSALNYTRLVAKKNRHQPQYGVVQISNGQGRAGNLREVAIFEAPGLNGLTVRFAAEDVKMVASILSRMHPGKTHLFETAAHQILRDGVIECIVEKPESFFPSTDKIFSAIPADRFQVKVHNLATQIQSLSVLASDPHLLVQLKRGGEHGSKLSLTVSDPSRGEGQTAIETWPVDGKAGFAEGWRITIPLRSLIRLVRYSSQDWVEIAVFDHKALMLVQKDDSIRTCAYIAAHQD